MGQWQGWRRLEQVQFILGGFFEFDALPELDHFGSWAWCKQYRAGKDLIRLSLWIFVSGNFINALSRSFAWLDLLDRKQLRLPGTSLVHSIGGAGMW